MYSLDKILFLTFFSMVVVFIVLIGIWGLMVLIGQFFKQK
ncbi:hypothetical protein I568_01664 [Enterococcus columbae DSM 7374 = ATCC 51263]|uniref:Uncharacterized protein n=1 Tax=Enterococcus columbae DSM 7374 = ATCC 51263 TaxID=1121865 RepID=S0KLR3_9ENTE|nr:hypothetical protein OMW_01044 [Enterococcus columbae DSM 7374 = ATCC 51263]EOW80487.1 hypothetical protein I568_01664 [Enterococcus columbae DSM 7374 = ATCC 51263]OJG26437.1 hypothetical protein RR47_GL000185 [Enterococcus columbae DSM 7374 = ATCC 51263]